MRGGDGPPLGGQAGEELGIVCIDIVDIADIVDIVNIVDILEIVYILKLVDA